MQNLDTEKVPNNSNSNESLWIASTTDASGESVGGESNDGELIEVKTSTVAPSHSAKKAGQSKYGADPTQKPVQSVALSVRTAQRQTKTLAKIDARNRRPIAPGSSSSSLGGDAKRRPIRKRAGAAANKSHLAKNPAAKKRPQPTDAGKVLSSGPRAKHFSPNAKALPAPPRAAAAKSLRAAPQAHAKATAQKRTTVSQEARPTKPGPKERPSNKSVETKSGTAIVLAKKLSQIPMPSVVLKSNKKKIPSAYHATGDVDTRSGFAKARQFVADQVRTPKVAVVGILLIIYIAGSVFWSTRFLPGTKVNGMDASWTTPASLAARLETEAPNYEANVSGKGVDLQINQGDIDLKFNGDAWASAARDYLPSFSWPLKLVGDKNVEIPSGVSYDRQKLENMVNAAVKVANQGTEESQNASIQFDESKDSFVPVKEKYGTAISPSRALGTISFGVESLDKRIELSDSDLKQPTLTVSSKDFPAVLDQANRVAHLSFDLTVNGKRVETVTEDMIRSWLTINSSHSVVADLDAVTEWTRGDFSARADTLSSTRTYTRTDDGKRITVSGGTYGWSVDGKKLASMIRKQISANSSESIEVPFLSRGEVFVHGAQDWGPRYIDVDLSEQYVRMFDEDSNIVMEAPCVTGNMAENNDTVVGVFTIEYKQSPATLIGLDEDYDGEPDYENEVGFWMPFYGGYGLHDALWRNYFGADAFQTDGSHGCVNLPYYAAEILYSVCEEGDVVVVHW